MRKRTHAIYDPTQYPASVGEGYSRMNSASKRAG